MTKARWCTGELGCGEKSWKNAIAFAPMVSFWIIDMKDGSDGYSEMWDIWDVQNIDHKDGKYFKDMFKKTDIPNRSMMKPKPRKAPDQRDTDLRII